jgi:hypothetical protein
MSVEPESLTPAEQSAELEKCGWKTVRVITWFSVGMAVAALGLYVGNELRCRAKFKRRTPYDFYANAGESAANEFGVGV